MLKFSANLGFLWTGLPLPEAIVAASRAGFDAVECHFPYQYPANEVAQALQESGLGMVSLNTGLGQNGVEDFGVLSLPGREAEARDLVEEAISYAEQIGCRNIHCIAGRSGGGKVAESVFRENLAIATRLAADKNITILIEGINQRDVPGFHFSLLEQGLETIEAVGATNLKLLFDCYHVQIMQGDLLAHFRQFQPWIGHIQFAAVPDRGEPDQGEVNYPWLLQQMNSAGWQGFYGAEYRPRGNIDDGLGWLQSFRSG